MIVWADKYLIVFFFWLVSEVEHWLNKLLILLCLFVCINSIKTKFLTTIIFQFLSQSIEIGFTKHLD